MDRAADVSLDGLRDTYAVHTLFRRELGLAPGLVRGIGDDDAARTWLVCEHLDLVITFLIGYHESRHDCGRLGHEDAGHVTRLAESEHARLHQVLDHVTRLVRVWRASAAALDAKPLADALEQLALLLNDYMARREEAILWPRMASVASLRSHDAFPPEWKGVVRPTWRLWLAAMPRAIFRDRECTHSRKPGLHG